MQPLLTVEGLRVGYEQIPVLHGVTFEVGQGEIVAILGPNGAGKTTALSCVSGLLRPWAGSVTFAGEPITGFSPDKTVARGMAHVPEGRRVFPALSVEENLRLGSWAVRRRPAEARANIERVYETFEVLADRRSQLAGTLSGGEQQMLAVGRALMSSPRLLIIDEAGLGLAPVMVDRVFQTIIDIRAAGATVLMVEQNAPATLRVADRVYLMQKGVIATGGPAAEVREAGVLDAYLGPMAAVAAKVEEAAGDAAPHSDRRETRPLGSTVPVAEAVPRPRRASGGAGRSGRASSGRGGSTSRSSRTASGGAASSGGRTRSGGRRSGGAAGGGSPSPGRRSKGGSKGSSKGS